MSEKKDDLLDDPQDKASAKTKAANTAEAEVGMDAKAMLKRNGEAERKIRYNDRITLEITTDKAKHYRKGQIIRPHRVMGEQLVKDGIAKEVK